MKLSDASAVAFFNHVWSLRYSSVWVPDNRLDVSPEDTRRKASGPGWPPQQAVR